MIEQKEIGLFVTTFRSRELSDDDLIVLCEIIEQCDDEQIIPFWAACVADMSAIVRCNVERTKNIFVPAVQRAAEPECVRIEAMSPAQRALKTEEDKQYFKGQRLIVVNKEILDDRNVKD